MTCNIIRGKYLSLCIRSENIINNSKKLRNRSPLDGAIPRIRTVKPRPLDSLELFLVTKSVSESWGKDVYFDTAFQIPSLFALQFSYDIICILFFVVLVFLSDLPTSLGRLCDGKALIICWALLQIWVLLPQDHAENFSILEQNPFLS